MTNYPQKGRNQGYMSTCPFFNFWAPCPITGTGYARHFKFSVQINHSEYYSLDMTEYTQFKERLQRHVTHF